MAVSVKLCAKIDQRLRALARQLNCSNHWLMVEAIRRFVEDEEARLRHAGAEERRDSQRGPALAE